MRGEEGPTRLARQTVSQRGFSPSLLLSPAPSLIPSSLPRKDTKQGSQRNTAWLEPIKLELCGNGNKGRGQEWGQAENTWEQVLSADLLKARHGLALIGS